MEEDNSKYLYGLTVKEKKFIKKLGSEKVEQLKSQGYLALVYLSWDEVNDIVRALEDRFGDLELNEIEDIDEKLVKFYERMQGHLLIMGFLREKNKPEMENFSCLLCGEKMEGNFILDDFWEERTYCKACWKSNFLELMSGKL